ncbi:MAG TPA: hypothetical protein VF173_26535 [Thermoanaerobaculia bacterium]|nr:hypothetical protein [Thermoanaerobaculia bacterium]
MDVTSQNASFLVSLPDAIITKAYASILILGTVCGASIGLAVRPGESETLPQVMASFLHRV